MFLFLRNILGHSAKLRLEDVLRTSPKNVLYTSSYGLLCSATGRLLLTSSGRWNVTSWGRPNLTSWGRPHIVLYIITKGCPLLTMSWGHLLQTLWGHLHMVYYVTPWNVSCRRPEGVPQRSHEDVVKMSLYGSIFKDKKRPRDKGFCIWS